MPIWGIILTVMAAIFLTAVVTAIYVRRKDRKKLQYMLDAFEDGEYNFRFKEDSKFNITLNRIKWIVTVAASRTSRSPGPNSSGC